MLHFCDGQSATPYEDGEEIECQLRTNGWQLVEVNVVLVDPPLS
jgi:hypothetical protein